MTTTKQIMILNICSTEERELKDFLFDKTLSHICCTDEDKSKGIIINECSTEEDKSECVDINTNKQKEANNEAEYEESSVTHEVTIYVNIYECGRSILNRLDMTYELACMATSKQKYFTKLLETVVDYNIHHNAPLSNEKI